MDRFKSYSREDLTKILGVSLSTVGRLVNEREIYSIRVGKSIRIPQFALDDYMHGRPAYRPADPLQEDDGQMPPTESVFNG